MSKPDDPYPSPANIMYPMALASLLTLPSMRDGAGSLGTVHGVGGGRAGSSTSSDHHRGGPMRAEQSSRHLFLAIILDEALALVNSTLDLDRNHGSRNNEVNSRSSRLDENWELEESSSSSRPSPSGPSCTEDKAQ